MVTLYEHMFYQQISTNMVSVSTGYIAPWNGTIPDPIPFDKPNWCEAPINLTTDPRSFLTLLEIVQTNKSRFETVQKFDRFEWTGLFLVGNFFQRLSF